MRRLILMVLLAAWAATAQTTYTPKFPGDPAHSNAEAAALGYMRTVLGAQREYKKKHGGYASSLASLVHSGSFTRRMTGTDRGEYTVHFKGTTEGFTLGLAPKQFDAEHRAFFADETGKIRGEADKPATAQSAPVK
ncbi:MAG: hypothetical protein LAN37_02080 [Acidobacteriia bacterium]|nr:hypothetical protein [Terriglobia bacterium]